MTCLNTVDFRAASGELARLAADIRILLFGVQCGAVVAGEPQQRVMRFTAEVA